MCLLSTVFLMGLSFNILTVKASGTIYIRADGSIDPSTPLISTIDYVTYTFTGNINDRIVVERDNIIVDGVGYTLQGPDIGTGGGIGVDLSGRSNVTIKNMTIKAFNYGIWLHESSNYNSIVGNNITARNELGIYLRESSSNIILGNSITDNRLWGMQLERYSSFNSISENNISNCGGGVLLTESSSNSISGNNIINNQYSDGVFLEKSFNNSISYNNISANNCMHACYLWCSEYNNLVRNNITENNKYGISLYASSNNLIEKNDITHNEVGIYFQGMWANKHNSFYHNNFIANSQQVHVEVYSYANFWDNGYPFGGNFWSNYTCIDLKSGSYQNETDSDGIGDMPYTIDANNTDNYPLMGMFWDFNATSEYNVQTICNSSISNFQFNGTAIMFNVTGVDGTTGFCRICVPTGLMNVPYRVFVNGTEASCNLLPCSNSTHSYLYFNYTHSTQEAIIIPEFPSFLILPLFMTATLLAVIVCRRKLKLWH